MSPRSALPARALLLAMTLVLGGCDLIDALLADPKAIQKEADAKAIGGACRITSQPGRGTRVELTVHFQPAVSPVLATPLSREV